MEQCKTCEFYDEDFDRMMIQHDDILIEGEEKRERHYCAVWHDWVSDSIFYGKEKCKKYRIIKEIFEEEEFLSRISEEDMDILVNSKSNEEIDKIIAKYSE